MEPAVRGSRAETGVCGLSFRHAADRDKGGKSRRYQGAWEVQLINVNSKMRKIEIIFKAKKAHLPLGENIIFSKDIDSLDLQYFMRLCRI